MQHMPLRLLGLAVCLWLLCLPTLTAVDVPGDRAALPTTTLASLAEQAVARGLPDARQTSLWAGRLLLADGDERWGLHLEVSDGRWLAGLAESALGRMEGVRIHGEPLPALMAWLRSYPPADERTQARAEDLRQRLQGDEGLLAAIDPPRTALPTRLLLAAIALQRRGLENASTQIAAAALGASTLVWDHEPALPPVDGEVTTGSSTQNLRRLLHAAFRSELARQVARPTTAPGPWASPEQLAAGALAWLEPTDPPHHTIAIAGLLAASRIASNVAADAPLPLRLAAWHAGSDYYPPTTPAPMAEREAVAFADELRRQLALPDLDAMTRSALQRQLLALEQRVRISSHERDHLLPLLDDEQPAAAVVSAGGLDWPRCLGDQAFVLLALELGFDPRPAVGRSLTAPWTATERRATAADLRAWLSPRQGLPRARILIDAVPRLPPSLLAQAVEALDDAERGPVFDALASHWRTAPIAVTAAPQPDDWPQHEELRGVCMLVHLGREHAPLQHAVDAWPLTGIGTVALALRRGLRGDPAPLDALTQRLAHSSDASDVHMAAWTGAILAAPSATRVALLTSWLAEPLRDPGARILSAALGGGLDVGVAGVLLSQDESLRPAHQVALWCLLRRVLDATQPLPPTSLSSDGQQLVFRLRTAAAAVPLEGAAASDLRLADVAGAILAAHPWQFGLTAADLPPGPDLRQMRARRDAALAAQRQALDRFIATERSRLGW
jgi:hypothetical protein